MIADRYKYSPLPVAKLDPDQLRVRDEVERKISTGEYPISDTLCFCGCSDFILLAERDRYGFRNSTVHCFRCGVIRTNPHMTDEAYQKFYDKEYRKIYSKKKTLDKNYIWADQLTKGRRIANFISQHIEIRGNVYEIGCGMGGILYKFRELGCNVQGVDYGSEFIQFGQEKMGEQAIQVGGIDKLIEKDESARLVMLNHVLEHIVDLDAFLQKVRELLSDDGYLYVAVPGMRNMHWGRGDFLMYLQNAHTFYFSLTTLRFVLECTGFEFIAGNETVESLFRKSDTYREKSDIPLRERDRITTYLRFMEFMHDFTARTQAQEGA